MTRIFPIIVLAAVAFCASPSRAAAPLKLAVFDLELDDFSAGGPLAGESAEETERLRKMTRLARELLAASGLFEIVDIGPSQEPRVAQHWLRKCNGCEADAARAAGADLSFVGFFRKISVMLQGLEFRIRDARSGELVNISQTSLRGETDESWRRALTYLIRHNLVEPELARRGGKVAE
ncbi:DUF3280 domain-containing protein [Methylosinus sp. Sm6]|uniref:DUF3280 domain-containing protein n=1 Tax=Methylosinus sp. Sm6 TaxID=2866948 RepID=UPI001C99454B|nr:DUF3280 domain-containing protein [Methylosinus sp. Sm6]MBY6243292.1 DUF3280 domain-containing protein [Methylosinus sp. Sm6]